MEKIIGKRTCEICEGTGKIVVSCRIEKDGKIIPVITAPCPKCRNKK